MITYNEVGTTPEHVQYRDWPASSLDPRTRDTFARLAYQHPAIQHYRRTGDSRPVQISDFLTTAQFHRLDLYAEFFRPIRLEQQLSLSLTDDHSTVIGIAFNRTRHDFSDTDRAVLTILRQPLHTALRRSRLRHRLGSGTGDELGELSPRERAILELVATGRTNVAIARSLDISPRTVAKHLEHAYRKLQVTSRAAAVASTHSHPRVAR